MLDDKLRELERRAKNGGPTEKLAYRKAVRNAGGSMGLDLTIPHEYAAVSWQYARYGKCLSRFREACADNPLQPFYQGKSRPLTMPEMLAALARDYGELTQAMQYSSPHGSYVQTTTSSSIIYGPRSSKITTCSSDLLALTPANRTFGIGKYHATDPGRDAGEPLSARMLSRADFASDDFLLACAETTENRDAFCAQYFLRKNDLRIDSIRRSNLVLALKLTSYKSGELGITPGELTCRNGMIVVMLNH